MLWPFDFLVQVALFLEPAEFLFYGFSLTGFRRKISPIGLRIRLRRSVKVIVKAVDIMDLFDNSRFDNPEELPVCA